MTKEEALEQAAADIQKKEQQEIAAKEISGKINSETIEIVKYQREQRVQELKEQQEAYIKVYKKENPLIAQEINDILGLSKQEKIQKSSLDNIMYQLELKDKEDSIRASFKKDEASFKAFNRGVSEFGRDVFISEFEKRGNNVYIALMKLYGFETINQLFEKIKLENQEREQSDKDLKRTINADKDEDMIDKIAKRVAEILNEKK